MFSNSSCDDFTSEPKLATSGRGEDNLTSRSQKPKQNPSSPAQFVVPCSPLSKGQRPASALSSPQANLIIQKKNKTTPQRTSRHHQEEEEETREQNNRGKKKVRGRKTKPRASKKIKKKTRTFNSREKRKNHPEPVIGTVRGHFRESRDPEAMQGAGRNWLENHSDC